MRTKCLIESRYNMYYDTVESVHTKFALRLKVVQNKNKNKNNNRNKTKVLGLKHIHESLLVKAD